MTMFIVAFHSEGFFEAEQESRNLDDIPDFDGPLYAEKIFSIHELPSEHSTTKIGVCKAVGTAKLYNRMKMLNITKLEIHAANACNFTCESCSHFSNNAHKGLLTPEDADQQMSLWSNRINPTWFSVLGGEPLLNPRIEDFLRVARKHWKQNIELITNGFLLTKFPNLGSLLNELNISLIISKHGNTPEFNTNWNKIIAYLDSNKTHYLIRNSFENWTRRYKGYGPAVLPYEDNRPEDSWNICPCKYCMQILDGKLYKCSVITYLQLQKRRWPEISPKWDQYLAYKPLEHTATDQELEEFVSRKHESICKMCPADVDQFEKPDPLITVGELLSKLNRSSQLP